MPANEGPPLERQIVRSAMVVPIPFPAAAANAIRRSFLFLQMLCKALRTHRCCADPLRIHLHAATAPASSPAPPDNRAEVSHTPRSNGAARRQPLNTAIPAGSLPCAASERSNSPATAEYRRAGRISHAPRSKGAARRRPLNTAVPAGSLMRRARIGRLAHVSVRRVRAARIDSPCTAQLRAARGSRRCRGGGAHRRCPRSPARRRPPRQTPCP